MRSSQSGLRTIAESNALALVALHQNWPNLVLAEFQTAITFPLAVRIGHIAFGFLIEK